MQHEYETDIIKLHWQLEALKGQINELEREREKTGNLLSVMRFMLIRALRGMGVEATYGKLTNVDLIRLFERHTRDDWRFSQCPNAPKLHCRPRALQVTRDHEIVGCDDCGWTVLDTPTASDSDHPAPTA